jgi:hypothetical protein
MPIKGGLGVTIPLATAHLTAFFRSVNHYFEWAEDD